MSDFRGRKRCGSVFEAVNTMAGTTDNKKVSLLLCDNNNNVYFIQY